MLRRRLAGRVTATATAVALAGTAVVLMSQAQPGASLEAATGSVAAADAPTSATIEIVQVSDFNWRFEPSDQPLAVGGTLTVHNGTDAWVVSASIASLGAVVVALFRSTGTGPEITQR